MTIRRVINNDARLQVREEGVDKTPHLTGYAIVFDSQSAPLYSDENDIIREVIAPEAVTRELLDRSDIVMTMFHDNSLILARSAAGKGTLHYDIDEHGVKFDFIPPDTQDGKKAVELVRRGDIAGCSFAFSTDYKDPDKVARSRGKDGDKILTTYTVREIKGIYDFTLTPHPAYPSTSVEAREAEALAKSLIEKEKEQAKEPSEQTREFIKRLLDEADLCKRYTNEY